MAAEYGHTKATFLESMLQHPRARREEKRIRDLAEEKLAFFGQRLPGTATTSPPTASRMRTGGGSRSPARWRRTPALLLLDEPAAGMNPHETHEITELIGKLRDQAGYTILVIEHDMHLVEGISDRVVALDHGIKIAEGSFDEVATNALVSRPTWERARRRRR